MLYLSRSHLGRCSLPSVVDDLLRELVPDNVAVVMGNQVKLGLPIKFDDDAFIVLVVGRPPPDPQESPDGGLASGTGVPATLRLGGLRLGRCLLDNSTLPCVAAHRALPLRSASFASPLTQSGLGRWFWLRLRATPALDGEVTFQSPMREPPRSASVAQVGLVPRPISPHRRLGHPAVAARARLLLALARPRHRAERR